METSVRVTKTSKEEVYREILPQIKALIGDETDWIANLANTAAVLKMAFPERISWVGFYLMKNGQLVLGPFQGKPACVRINLGKGVCGSSASSKKSVIVPNVEEFPGHIYCDPDSKSEIVVPMLRGDSVIGVLDLDSSTLASFDDTDRQYLEEVVGSLTERLKHSSSTSLQS